MTIYESYFLEADWIALSVSLVIMSTEQWCVYSSVSKYGTFEWQVGPDIRRYEARDVTEAGNCGRRAMRARFNVRCHSCVRSCLLDAFVC